MIRTLLTAGLLIAPCLAGNDDPSKDGDEKVEEAVEGYLRTVVVTATRSPAVAFDTPYSAESVTRKLIRRRSYRTMPQALRNVPGVAVQETAFGQGSPYIRGFTGYRTLFLVDGIRLNNSVWRSGPNQYTATVDAFSIDHLEVVKGPSSVLFGSDAIGGTVNAITINPYDLESFGGRLLYRGATAENSHIVRGEVSGGFRGSTGAILGLTAKQFGDLIAGDNTRQTDIGYEELAGDFKAEHWLDEHARLVLGFQHVDQDDVPRTHKTIWSVPFEGTTPGSEWQRTLDQRRTLAYLQFHRESIGGAIDSVRASLSYQDQQEDRFRVRPPSGGGTEPRIDEQGFDVGTIGFWAQATSETPIGTLTYGLDYYHDDVDSYSSGNPVQGPVGDDATYDLFGIFIQDDVEIGERWGATAGLRFNYAAADAKSVLDPVTGNTIRVKGDWNAFVGNLRGVYRIVPGKWHLFGGVSQGFRAPNLSDLTRFDSARTNEFEVPAPGLDPEHYTQLELGIKGETRTFSAMFSGYYTDIRDQITRVPTGAQTPDGESIVTKDNVGDGYVWGLEFGAAWRFARGWTLFGNAAWVEGKTDTFPTSQPIVAREYLDKLMPLTGQLGVLWEPRKNLWVEALGIAASDADRLSTRDRADTSRIPPGGTPGYAVLHLRAGWRPKDWVSLTIAIENLFDDNYRIHGSGHNMPGRNFVFTVSFDF